MSIFDVVPVTAEDHRRRARRRVPRFLFDYLDGAANDELTLRANVSDVRALRLKQRVMRDVSSVSTDCEMLGFKARMPLVLAPVGMAGIYARRGEVQGARAAGNQQVPFTLSTVGICPLEEVQAATHAPFWFQLYMLRDREFILRLLQRAKAAGCTTLAFTVDLPLPGMRLRDYRNGMLGGGLPGKLSKLAQLAISPAWAWDVGIKGKPHTFGNIAEKIPNPEDLDLYKTFIDSQFDPSCTWDDIRWLREQWEGKLLVKGVMEADDARAAVDAGCDAVLVSNHGARQLDSVASSIAKLPGVVDAVGEQVEVYVDGGIRSGIDTVKALCLGARGVFLGRPWIYALASRGQAGVEQLLELFQKEMATAMALMGVNCLEELGPDLLD
ncbi:L-lactate dehydrogenase [Parahaliea mediterranea]|uniref:L-lactate dehydrogenase n=1 Tax=Parahaliea mediterranea TaxID=651086 RepID=A0A939IJH5_9GAMM|nr:L-lactate dehydrogenase [Parahaliea mediterranea]MBN7797669.1 L-lactate dehydrogenase [Parahaliea mediterranea]